ncbi:MAG: hypothetical protein K1X89_19995 [Myxococcaceae bacterium]|nr:hypothetical protein [Myxococcaceae bacterium]
MPTFRKLGLVYAPNGSAPWARQAAMLPTPLMLDEHRVRVYFASTDEHTVGRVGFVELDVRRPLDVLRESSAPVLDIGVPGAFDDNGVNPCCLVQDGAELRLYYVGYQLHRKIPYTLFTGVAVSRDGGETFERRSQAPVLDRTDGELFFRTAPFVAKEGAHWRVWYIAGAGWTQLGGRTQPLYSLHTLTSPDGLSFQGRGQELLAPRTPDEIGFGRPFFRSTAQGHELYYSVRSPTGYRLGFARSADRLHFERADDALVLEGATAAWESEMTCYSALVETRHSTLMLYNGNGYGRTGFGAAVLER